MVAGMRYKDQFQLINAPAGSGKTTMINQIITSLPREDNKELLCITFTNKAVEEIEHIVDQDYVKISTIHSFISTFMLPFFHDANVIETYFEIYHDKIVDKLNNLDETDQIYYCEIKGLDISTKLDIDIIKNNTDKLMYNESIYKNYLYGELNHDDLLSFTYEIFDRYTKLKRNLSDRFSHIIIDEYQDTHYKIVELFYNSVKDSSTKFWLFGDKMQQIYEESNINHVVGDDFRNPRIFEYNWRSQGKLVDVLNNLYYDPSYEQTSKNGTGEKPLIRIIKEHNYKPQKDKLLLVLLNNQLFTQINAKSLYDTLVKLYPYGSNRSAKDILISLDIDNDNKLMQILSAVELIRASYQKDKFGELTSSLKHKEFINDEFFKLNNINDINKVASTIEDFIQIVNKVENICEIIEILKRSEMFQRSYLNQVESKLKETNRGTDFYNSLLSVRYTEFINCYNESKNPKILTQHSVKGQGHNKVVINIDDSIGQPNVRMYRFLYYLSHNIFSLESFEALHEMILKFINDYDINFKKMKKIEFEDNLRECQELFNTVEDLMKDQYKSLYDLIEDKFFKQYRSKKNVTKFKEFLKLIAELNGVIQAAKLFYVGCSRAKEELTIYVLEDKLVSFDQEFITKFTELGFRVSCELPPS